MSWTLPKTWVSGAVLSKTDLDTQVRDNLNYLKTNIALEEAVELTIADGEITIAYSHHSIDTEGDAASDELVTINGGEDGRVILIRPASGDRTVILKHGLGNIYSPSGLDITLDDEGDYCLLIYDGTRWCAITAGAAASSAFTELTDAPASYEGQGGKLVSVKADESGLEFTEAEEPELSAFTDLTDTPASYEGQGGKVVAVKGDQTGLEFREIMTALAFDGGEVTDPNNTIISIDLGGA